MAASGVGELVFIDGNMDKFQYLNILKGNVRKSAEKLGISNDFYFQQDNDPKHTAEIVRLWLLYNTPHTLKTPPQSPDTNPIEHLWSELESRLRKHHITRKAHLKQLLQHEWGNISSEITQKLVFSMPNRLKEIIYRKGKQTRY